MLIWGFDLEHIECKILLFVFGQVVSFEEEIQLQEKSPPMMD
jgi:hypothetical protein